MDKKVYLGSCAPKSCPGPVHVIEPGDTLYSIAKKYHTRVRILLSLNPFVDIYNLQPGEEICVPMDTPAGETQLVPHVVKKGETIGHILEKYQGSPAELLKSNRCLYDITIPEGMILLLPGQK